MDQQHISGYFDYNATTPISDEVAQSMIPVLTQFANPSSSNSYSILCKSAIVEAREQIARLINTKKEKVFFTSGGSEANNWAIKGVLLQHIKKPGHIITTAIEHASVLDTIRYCVESFGFEVTYLKPDEQGVIRLKDFQDALRADTQLISIMYANNETGVIQPIEIISRLAKEKNIPLHVDAVQVIGKRKVDVESLNINYLSISAHKFYGPKGVGCLYIKDVNSIGPLIHGGGQEQSMRSGTENLVALVGMSKAAQEASLNVAQWDKDNWQCKQHMINLLKLAPIEIKFNGHIGFAAALSNTLNISIKGVRGEALAARMEMLHNYIFSIGSACSNNKTKKSSHVLQAMSMQEEDIQNSIRISFGRFTSIQAVEKFIETLIIEAQKLLIISGSRHG
ncbi:cysteine desulfurase family protein [Rheinheimera sp. MMS21-TC3]|uniref:cysteine desulfurase family protein n=1 Tax=Rheinheimera sp. MMS21-TC3 TaxID=3072790 RepID=UPI0028C3D116|nr:cysteine desulfurase family protein [Rheinheimera sp. MMS21-TC3]WNO60625.1 cysteine desulfurase family protein [Rheinheimera sp. MMS21-TC3]